MARLYGAAVSGIGKCLPKKKLTNFDLEKMVDTSDDWIITRTGIRERYIISEGESVSSLGAQAALQAMSHAGVSAEEIDLVVTGTFTADHRLPSCACLIHDAIGAKNAAAFDINAACTGFIYSLLTGAQFIKTGSCKHVLVVGADATSTVLDWTDRNTCVLFGDGASAVVLSRSENEKDGVQSDFICTDGSGKDSLWIPVGGSLDPLTPENFAKRLHYVQMAGKDVFKFAINALTSCARNVMNQEGVNASDIALMVPHQANLRIISAAARKLGFSEEQVYVNIDKYGNTVGASIGIALRDACDEGRLKKGDKILLVGFGAGLSWGATIVNWSMGS